MGFHDFFVPWCLDHPDITLIKYQTLSDPYAIEESDVRIDYYNVNGIPRTFCNGDWVQGNTQLSNFQRAYDSAIILNSPFEIVSSFNVVDSMIHITTGILPHGSASDLTIHTALVERTVYGNLGSNGDTVHYHCLMKMFPDAFGESASFYNSIPYSQSFSYDLSQTNVEELDDLILAIFIQDDSTKEVFQSAYAFGDTNLSSNAYLQAITIDGVEIDEFEPHIEDYFLELPPGTPESPVVEGIPSNENALLSTVQAFVLPGSASIDVYSEDRTEWKRYSVYISYAVGVDELRDAGIELWVYPNPCADAVRLRYKIHDPSASLGTGSGYLISDLYTIEGRMIRRIVEENIVPGEHEIEIDVSDLPAGMYYYKIVAGEQAASVKIVKIK